MKKYLIFTFIIVIMCLTFLTACGSGEVSDEKADEIIEASSSMGTSVYTEEVRMTQAQFDKTLGDCDEFVYEVLSFSGDIGILLNDNSQEISESETINLSTFSQFIVAKENLENTIQSIKSYNTSGLSDEFKNFFSKLLEYAVKIEYYANEMSQDLTIDELAELIVTGLSETQEEYIEQLGDLIVAAGKAMDEQNATETSNTEIGGNTCTYKYIDGSICGAKTNKYTDLCDEHFEELYATYQGLGGTRVPKY